MAASTFARFATLFAVLVVISYVAATPCPEPEPQPEPEPRRGGCCGCCGCGPTCGASETKCGAVIVPTCVTMHHRCGTIRRCCRCCGGCCGCGCGCGCCGCHH